MQGCFTSCIRHCSCLMQNSKCQHLVSENHVHQYKQEVQCTPPCLCALDYVDDNCQAGNEKIRIYTFRVSKTVEVICKFCCIIFSQTVQRYPEELASYLTLMTADATTYVKAVRSLTISFASLEQCMIHIVRDVIIQTMCLVL